MDFKLLPLILFSATLLFSTGCGNEKQKAETAESAPSDSTTAKLNSPELKKVNAELRTNPDSPDLYDRRARIYRTLGQEKESVNDSKRAIRLDSTKSAYYMTLADTYFSSNSTRLAKELLEVMERKFPADVEVLLKLSELYFLVRQYQKAIDYVNKALKIDENMARAYYIKGSIYRESGDTTRAISSLETAVEQDNRYVDAFYDLGIIYAARRNPLAMEYYNNVLRVQPGHSDALYARAKFLQDAGKVEEAIREYEALAKADPKCANCYYNLGAISLEIKKNPSKAVEYFSKAISANPKYIEAYFARGYSYTKLKDKESALADYRMCLELEPGYTPAVEEMNAIRQ